MSVPNVCPPNDLAQLLDENGLWTRDCMEGCHSLCRAISASLFFTERHHQQVQKKLVHYFLLNLDSLPFKFLKHFSKAELVERFTDMPHLFEFESVNLELAAHAFDCKVKLYYSVNHKFCSELYFRPSKRVIKLFRVSNSHYSPLFKKNTHGTAVLCQGLVLSLIDKVLGQSTNVFDTGINKNFINFDLELWKRQSGGFATKTEVANGGRFPFVGCNSSHNGESNQQQGADRKEMSSIGEDLLEIIKKRKSKSTHQEDQQREKFLKSFVDPLIFFQSISKGEQEQTKSILSCSATSEDLQKRYNAENTKLSRSANMNEIFSFFDKNEPQKSEDSARSSLSNEDAYTFGDRQTTNGQNSKPREYQRLNSIQTNDTNTIKNHQTPPKLENSKNSLRQKLKARQQMPKEFAPPHPTSKGSQSPKLSTPPAEARPFGTSTQLFDRPGLQNQTSASSKNERLISDPRHRDRYLETIDAILYDGRLKFFDEKNGYGFMLLNEGGVVQDLFVYKNEFERAKVPLDLLRQVKNGLELNFTFQIARYTTRGQTNKKAINIRLVK